MSAAESRCVPYSARSQAGSSIRVVDIQDPRLAQDPEAFGEEAFSHLELIGRRSGPVGGLPLLVNPDMFQQPAAEDDVKAMVVEG